MNIQKCIASIVAVKRDLLLCKDEKQSAKLRRELQYFARDYAHSATVPEWCYYDDSMNPAPPCKRIPQDAFPQMSGAN